MAIYIALLRGINVGGSGLLPMKDLVRHCGDCGLEGARTYIQSGNVVFESRLAEAGIRTRLEKKLEAVMGKKIDVMVRSAEEMRQILRANPFPEKEGAKVAVAFLHETPQKNLVKAAISPGGEEVRPGKREIYVYYPDGMGRSKLKLPVGGASTTVRNINTVAKLVEMTGGSA
jgi:uncharacterized protein (DUF1697 family)